MPRSVSRSAPPVLHRIRCRIDRMHAAKVRKRPLPRMLSSLTSVCCPEGWIIVSYVHTRIWPRSDVFQLHRSLSPEVLDSCQKIESDTRPMAWPPSQRAPSLYISRIGSSHLTSLSPSGPQISPPCFLYNYRWSARFSSAHSLANSSHKSLDMHNCATHSTTRLPKIVWVVLNEKSTLVFSMGMPYCQRDLFQETVYDVCMALLAPF